MKDKGKTAYLVLEDGTKIKGNSFGAEKISVSGEIVFNTAMNGYPESLTDPSYKGQILVMTSAVIGNYGIPKSTVIEEIEAFFESSKIQIKGLIINYYSEKFSHWNAEKDLSSWLKENNIPALCDVDTRMIAKILREKGNQRGKIIFEKNIPFDDSLENNLVEEVSIKEVKIYKPSRILPNEKNIEKSKVEDSFHNLSPKKVVIIDCGVKNNIIRSLLKRNIEIIRVPWNFDFNTIEYDGLFISNGPGDPQNCDVTIRNIQKAMVKNKPIFGICLGNQLLAIAAGAKTYRLKYGHRGHNQPIRQLGTNKCFITVQNHGYVVDERTLPEDWEQSFININDGTCEGIKHKSKPFSSVQFHPEANGGPWDTEFLFDNFVRELYAE